MKKKLLSLLLVITMAIGMLPATAYAIGSGVSDTIAYTITFNANGGVWANGLILRDFSTDSSGLLTQYPTLNSISRSGFHCNGWFTAPTGGIAFDNKTKHTQNTTYYAQWTSTGSGGNSSSGGGGGGGSSGTPPLATSSNVDGDGKVLTAKATEQTTAAIAEAKKNGTAPRANIVTVNPVYILPQTLQEMAAAAAKAGGTAWLFADSVTSSKVMVRIYLNTAHAPSYKEKVLLGGAVTGKAVEATTQKFAGFDNKLAVVSLTQKSPFPVTTEIAAKVDLTGLNTKSLYFYSYDEELNRYYPINAPSYRIDQGGYLHWNTLRAGEIVITDKPLP